jgi:hypothetical protein
VLITRLPLRRTGIAKEHHAHLGRFGGHSRPFDIQTKRIEPHLCFLAVIHPSLLIQKCTLANAASSASTSAI